ncbi:hypothetical protein KIH79_04895 [Bifidobacterium sp. 82T10]|uniref:Uncharacterized protein n=1 Tax=Bifidobacterium miconis TaxID=2834435 RepID=A0ABS6WE34_9BIFI|nr:hypothetical protein [Bifidobacterium miconis]MBW3092298.1 hypothetical protein [Bifidobacterium miconis]
MYSIQHIAKTRGHCHTGKNRYATADEAQLALASCRGSASNRRREQRIYHCPMCKGWHLTSHDLRPLQIDSQEYDYCQTLMFAHGDHILNVSSNVFELIGIRSRKAQRVITVAGLHCLREAGVPESAFTNPWVWRTLRLAYDANGSGLEQLLAGFMSVCRKLAAEYETEHEQWAMPNAGEHLGVCYGERQQARTAAIRAWILRASEADAKAPASEAVSIVSHGEAPALSLAC